MSEDEHPVYGDACSAPYWYRKGIRKRRRVEIRCGQCRNCVRFFSNMAVEAFTSQLERERELNRGVWVVIVNGDWYHVIDTPMSDVAMHLGDGLWRQTHPGVGQTSLAVRRVSVTRHG